MVASSVVCAEFDPSRSFLATGHVSLDRHQVKVQSVTPSQGSLNVSFTLGKLDKLTRLTWVSYKEHQVVAICLTRGVILVYSPLTNDIVCELQSPTSSSSIQDLHYSHMTNSAWSCDIDGNICEWDFMNFSLKQTFSISEVLENAESINRVCVVEWENEPHLLLGQHSITLISIRQSKQVVKAFPGHIQPVNAIVPIESNSDLFLTSGESDRFINLYSLSKGSTSLVFVTQSPVSTIEIGSLDSKSILAVINDNGNVEIFNDFLNSKSNTDPSTPQKQPLKKKRRQAANQVQTLTPNGSIKISRPDLEIKCPDDANLIIDGLAIMEDSIYYSWIENGNVPFIDSAKWINEEGIFTFNRSITISKSKPDLKAISHTEAGHDIAASKHYNESNAIINDGLTTNNVVNYSDNDEDDEDREEGESLAEKLDKLSTDNNNQKQNPTKSNKKKLTGLTSSLTLTIVLSQALKNNDHALFETVLSNKDPQVIQNTIMKLDPSLAILLVDRISERVQRQTSKFDQLNVWLKWITIIHGGYLSSVPNLSAKLSSLHSFLVKKSNSLPRLLELQSRFNMLFQQMELQKEILKQSVPEDQDDESDVEYIEELDDAQLLQEIEIDSDDEEDDEEDEEEDDEDEDVEEAEDDDSDEENYSDLEADITGTRK
ncbi:Small subunit (SSU) processome component [Scheffersomyces spartinae]|uniref:Small subunit (SSU) processome component n=1 Tax=Scheffersomyces spartinae TaxID=45513 RepID=A0A9P8AKW9_9ASCO|nr:Small subunit (SSU) processome component [Scheffersomyces spartinae]KAG7195514.1 Small subunit (SSU) processome component [Scheffersomyces spartinae]